MERVLLPVDNKEDWAELDKDIRNSLQVDFVETVDEAFAVLFTKDIVKKISRQTKK
jgi:ATP-dependent Lon protease